MKHEAFQALRSELRRTRPQLLDLAETNLYRSLALPSIPPSQHPEAPYRCHLAERFLVWLELPAELRSRAQISHGVRRSLAALLELLATRGARVGMPSDVYPVYLQLAAQAGVQLVRYAAREGLPALDELDALLVCEPLKPWGRSLDAASVDALERWALADPARLLVIDSAYAMPPTSGVRRLIEADAAAVSVSLSKGWLLPDHAGLCLVPTHWREPVREAFGRLAKDELKLRIAHAALREHAERPREVAARLAARAEWLDAITGARPELAASRCVGYFASAAASFEQLLACDVLAIPATVFGGPPELSVLSALEPVG